MASGEANLKISLGPAAFQAGLRNLVNYTKAAGNAMGSALKEPMNAGLKSTSKEIGGMFSELKSGLRTVGTLGGALALGSFIRDGLALQRIYGDMAGQISKVTGRAMSWQAVQQIVEAEATRTGEKVEGISEAFMTMFKETANVDISTRALKAINTVATALGYDMHQLADATQIAMTKFSIRDPEEALGRVVDAIGEGGMQLDQLSGKFEMAGEAAAAAGHTGGEAMSFMLNAFTEFGDKSLNGLNKMFLTMKDGSGQVLRLQKAMGTSVKFTADMSALDRVRATFMSPSGRKAAEKLFSADARVVYDKLAEPFDQAYDQAMALAKKGDVKAKAEATAKGLAAFDENIKRLSQSTTDFTKLQEQAARRLENDPGRKLDLAIEKIRLKFTDPKVIGAMDQLADRLPVFADTVSKIIGYVVDNPWQSLATVVAGKLALAFGSTVITEVIKAGMTSLFARMAAVQAASTAASVATQGATALGVGGAIGAGAAGAGTGAGAVAATGATVAAGVLGAGAVGAGLGYAFYKGVMEDQQEGEFDAIRNTQETLMTTGGVSRAGSRKVSSESDIKAALQQLKNARSSLKSSESSVNDWAGGLMRPFTNTGDPRDRAYREIGEEEKRLMTALKNLREGVQQTADVTKRSTSRGPLRPADSSPGAKPVTG